MKDQCNLKQLVMIGFDYNKTPINIREKVSFTPKSVEKAYELLKINSNVKESIILSTCNRSEIYTVLEFGIDNANCLKNFYSEFFGIDKHLLNEYIEVRQSEDLVKHIFEVACGFKSLVIGEDQILGQVKDAYGLAIKWHSSGKILNKLFLNAITTAKKIKTATGISKNSLSISSIGVKLLEQKLEKLSDKKALIVGLGEMSKISIKNLLDKNIEKIFVTNRTSTKMKDFTCEFPDIVQVDFKDRYKFIKDVDIIISCTAAPHFVMHYDIFREYYTGKPIYILDLAVPRDVEPDIVALNKNITLYKLDDLIDISNENKEIRARIKEKSIFLLKHDLKSYIKWLEEIDASSVITSMQDYSMQVIEQELCSLREKLHSLPETDLLTIEKSYRSLAKSLVHKQTMKIKELLSESFQESAVAVSKEGKIQ